MTRCDRCGNKCKYDEATFIRVDRIVKENVLGKRVTCQVVCSACLNKIMEVLNNDK